MTNNDTQPAVEQANAHLAGLRALHSQLDRSRRHAAALIAAAEQPEPSVLEAARELLDAVPVPDGCAADVWRPAADEHNVVRRWIVVKESTVFDGDRVAATVLVAGVETVRLVHDGEWCVDSIEIGGWCVQVDVQRVLDAARANELAQALGEAGDYLARLAPESVTLADELAARRSRSRKN